MSPERAGLGGLDIDTRSDIYSLGVLLYELLIGKPPLDVKALTTGGLDEMRRFIQEIEAPRPSTRVSKLDPAGLTTLARKRRVDIHRFQKQIRGDLDWVVLKALEKDRTRRYQTATAFAEEICRYLNNEPVSAVAPTAVYLFIKYARRHRASLAIAAGIAALLVGSAGYISAQAAKAREAALKASEAERLRSPAPPGGSARRRESSDARKGSRTLIERAADGLSLRFWDLRSTSSTCPPAGSCRRSRNRTSPSTPRTWWPAWEPWSTTPTGWSSAISPPAPCSWTATGQATP